MPVNFTRMSDQEEIRIGNELARLYGRNENQTIQPGSEAEVENYLTEVGQRLAANAHRKLPYKFHYIHNASSPMTHDEINAFALPGGHIYVTEGMLSIMDSEDELAAVIGHEIEHVDHYHCAERAQQQEALRKIPLGGLIEIPISAFEAGYSKDQELEADREGTRLAVQAGYSPEGAIRLFEKIEQLYKESPSRPWAPRNPMREASELTRQALEGYFRTHPLTSERIAQIQKLIARENWAVHAERDLAVAYIFLNEKATQAYFGHRYAEAEKLDDQSLNLHPEQRATLTWLARAQFAQAEFAEAAATYRKTLDTVPSAGLPQDVGQPPGVIARRWNGTIDEYAEALAAADRQTAAGEFRHWADSNNNGGNSSEIELDEAGLALLAGDSGPASKLEPELSHVPSQPEELAKMGWWHYWVGDYAKALELLSMAYQRRPNDEHIQEHLAWTEIELQRYADALQTASHVVFPQLDMAPAVASWKAQDSDRALRYFNVASRARPEWLNPKWVSALYSPTVVQAISDMQQEALRRQQQHRQQ